MKKLLILTILALLAIPAFAGQNEKFTGSTQVVSGSVTLKSGTSLTGSTGSSATLVSARITPAVTVVTADGAITKASGVVFVEKTGSAAALTIAAPATQDGTRITFITNTAFAHVITFTGGTLWDGTAGVNTTATFGAVQGASLTVIARGTKWYVESFNVCTIAP